MANVHDRARSAMPLGDLVAVTHPRRLHDPGEQRASLTATCSWRVWR
jgi:hypothetical protein